MQVPTGHTIPSMPQAMSMNEEGILTVTNQKCHIIRIAFIHCPCERSASTKSLYLTSLVSMAWCRINLPNFQTRIMELNTCCRRNSA